MFRWLAPLTFDDPETTRQANLVFRLTVVMTLVGISIALMSMLDPTNPVRVTVILYSGIVVCLAAIGVLVRKGYVRTATWMLVLWHWALIAMIILFFGGLRGEYAAHLGVSTLLAGLLLGFRSAMGLAVASSLWCAGIAYLEASGTLPTSLSPYTPWNSWGSVTATIFLTTALLWVSTERLRKTHEGAEKTARERDEALRRSISGQKMELVGSLTSGIAHDINNLLTIIVGASSSLKAKSSPTDAEAQGLLEELDVATSRAALMTSQLLAFGRSPTQHIEEVDLSASVERTGRLLARVLGVATACKFEVEPGVRVQASRTGIEQILLNLAVNARDAMPNGGELRVSVRKDGNFAELAVADTGHGMDESTRARIFEPFFSTKPTGTGLGLATVRQLIQHYGGRIELETAVGEGAAFRLWVPLTIDPASERSTPDSLSLLVAPSHAGGTILLVEDDAFVRRALARMLTADGFDVVTAENGGPALELVRSERKFVCVVSDVVMPQMGGEALARELRESHPKLPLVLISGNQEVSPDVLEGLPRLFLNKPVEAAKLRHALYQLIGARRLEGL
jgi:signal transduction histidine kinase/CheY-like chemotaxis protein